MIDYAALAARAFDVPLDADEREALRVWGDLLQGADDARGTLIALEHAILEQPARTHELRQAMRDHLFVHGGALIGQVGPLLQVPRGLALDWRAGQLYSAELDTRNATLLTELSSVELVRVLLDAPMTATARRLHIRVRTERQVAPVVNAIGRYRGPLAIEQLIVAVGVREQVIVRSDDPLPEQPLWLYARGGSIAALATTPVHATDDPETLAGRVRIGRALVHPDHRAGALARIANLGPRAFAFADTLAMLLAPRIVTEQSSVVEALVALGTHARRFAGQLATITGRPTLYDVDTRRAAGIALAKLG